MNDWCFSEPPNTIVITTKNIMLGNLYIKSVYHDIDDGFWQFLDGTEISENDAVLVSLDEIIQLDSSIKELNQLPLGWEAHRENIYTHWVFVDSSSC